MVNFIEFSLTFQVALAMSESLQIQEEEKQEDEQVMAKQLEVNEISSNFH
jgi:hypothetical protein